MPLLAPEPFVSSEDLLSDPARPPAAGRWWVLHTRPRAEKRLARELLSRRCDFFLPQHTKTWQSRGSTLSSQLPLFPGYLFLHGDWDARGVALETNQVACVIPVEDQRRLHNDLVQVHQLMISGLPLSAEDRLQPGMMVEVEQGPLAGLTGRVLKKGKELRVLVEVQLLQRGVSAEIETWMLRALL